MTPLREPRDPATSATTATSSSASPGSVTTATTLRTLLDRQAIADLIASYCRAVDRRDYAAVREVYTADGVDHHTGFTGQADDYVTWLRERTAGFTGTMHVLGTQLITVHGDTAVAETYGTAHHWGEPATDATRNFTSGFRYLDRLRRENDGWRIAERFAVREWTRSDAGRLTSPEGPGPRGVRGPGDPLYVEGFAVHSDQAVATEHA